MCIEDIITALDAEINRLHQARSNLASLGSTSALHAATATKPVAKPRRQKLSAAARKRIDDAQRARWAKQKSGK